MSVIHSQTRLGDQYRLVAKSDANDPACKRLAPTTIATRTQTGACSVPEAGEASTRGAGCLHEGTHGATPPKEAEMFRATTMLLVTLFTIGCTGSSATPDASVRVDAPLAEATVGVDVTDATSGDAVSRGCTSNAQCDDSIACTEDACLDVTCRHTAVPARCGAGQTCDVRLGCQAGRICGRDADCTDTDPCTMGEHCDTASRVCLSEVLDGDGDGVPPRVCGGSDCDDGQADVHPGAAERCNGRDDNCDGTVDGPTAAMACGMGFACTSGVCTCPGTRCMTACVDLQTDGDNCGVCGRSCGASGVCVAGTCRCAGVMTDCGPGLGCIDTTSNPMHCGRCGSACGSGATCSMGACRCAPGTSPCFGGVSVFETSEPDEGLALAVDPTGNVVATGRTADMINFGSGALTGRYTSVFAASFTETLSHRWSQVFAGSPGSRSGTGMPPFATIGMGKGIATDAAGNVYLGGSVRWRIGFGGMALDGGPDGDLDGFVASFDQSGTHRWSRRLGYDFSQDEIQGVGTDDAGNVYIAGVSSHAINLGGDPLGSSSSGRGFAFVASYSQAGAHRSQAIYRLQGRSAIVTFAVAGDGTPYMAGTVESLAPGELTVIPVGRSEGATWYLRDPGGDLHGLGTVGFANSMNYISPTDIAADRTGVYVVGSFRGTIDLGGGNLVSEACSSIFLAAFSPRIEHRWSRRYATTSCPISGEPVGMRLARDRAGNLYVVGIYGSSVQIDFGGGTLTSTAGDAAFLAAFTNTGTYRWARSLARNVSPTGSAATITIDDIAAGATDSLYVTGALTRGSFDFGSGPQAGARDGDMFLARYMP